ncbi:sugar transferase [Paenibacillus terrigena]|uniref:sugar transferase n=1 Tax=Paenibacillus terrigena TaxID=369333 RepID=UPI0003704408|nr:sugar transferase [Paenibacillus terrigena]
MNFFGVLNKWDGLPINMQNQVVRKHYERLENKQIELILKRCFDIMFALLLLIILSPVFLLLSIVIKIDSKGSVMFRQVRVTQYGREFRIFKFRTMVVNSEKIGSQVTINNDNRITNVGKFLRKVRLDELPQLINIISGDMSFVGTRPEVVKYVEHYSDEMLSTLLLPAGVTSRASIEYKDENKLLSETNNIDDTYIKVVLPQKMKINLEYTFKFGLIEDIRILINTVLAVIGK